eukprot:11722.XXX_812836_812994_1 [CDS] Oithona nana genome sequencing.
MLNLRRTEIQTSLEDIVKNSAWSHFSSRNDYSGQFKFSFHCQEVKVILEIIY